MKHRRPWRDPNHWPHPPRAWWQHDDQPAGEIGPPATWPHAHKWKHKGGCLFVRFAGVFGVITLMVLGGIAALAFLLTRVFGGDGQTALLVWIGGCGLAVMLPLLAGALGRHAFRRIASPLADVMDAADAVAVGDLSVRVPARGPGEFGRLAQAFNHMIEELERADQQRRNLTADVAHELRTPLHIIQGNLEGVLDDVYQPTPEHIGATLDETRLLARLVDDLQTLSLAEAGQLPLTREPVDVAELLADVGTSFIGQAEAAGINLQVETDAGSASMTTTGDVGRLDQVLSNLMGNALRHTPAGGTITLGAESADGWVRIIVADTGQGIPAEDLPYVFERFWRGDRARSHASGVGSGLGLAIARRLVQAHGGQISVESQVGVGTTFFVELPEGDETAGR